MSHPIITIFTPTYNRGYILHKLYESLLRQTEYCFEWLIIDDGSTDTTEDIVKEWIRVTKVFKIRYYITVNGGKPRAINKAVHLANTPYLFIVDSDDYLVDEIMFFLSQEILQIKDKNEIAAIGLIQGKNKFVPLQSPDFRGADFLEISNIERPHYHLNFDCNEVYKISILKKYPFEVWEGELFSPEEIVFNQIALDGYKIRWYNKVGVISAYLNDGLTMNSNQLIQKNPMGYAMLFNHQLKYKKGFFQRMQLAYLVVCYSLLGFNLKYIRQSNARVLTFFAFPLGCLVAVRRLCQYKRKN